ncbi:hypothetical protein CANMA_002446 [Candida margitis]|uniref:uncharacterized protein n=1 Tax=Candida margitis TaxID=1775924 RepID=UPI002226100B|nr:uncharacterized protein CANMA_002446 [Candida margitis]KAI5968230.1 hypothetical protein CANMA_002446 [Candida margitis]
MATLYTAQTGNGRKPLILVKLLNAPIKVHLFDWPTDEIKSDSYLKLNPNGLVPTLVDEEVGSIFESNAVLEYIAAKYDKEGKYSYKEQDNYKLYWHQKEWLYFQAAQFAAHTLSRGVYYSQINPDDDFTTRDVLENFAKLYGVIEGQLEKNGSGWLIGDKFTIVDIAFATGNHRRIEVFTGTDYEIKDFNEKYPRVVKWYENVLAIDGVKDVLK